MCLWMMVTLNNKQNIHALVKKIFKKFILTLRGSMLWNNFIYYTGCHKYVPFEPSF